MFYLIAGVTIAALAAYSLFTVSDDRNDRSPSHSRSYESSRPPVIRRDERQKRHTIEPPSRRDHIEHTPPVEDSASLRERANREGDLMTQCFQQSKEAYDCRDHVRAKALKERGRRHELTRKNLHEKASAAIYKENNQNRPADEIDLHRLHVSEAITYTDKAIADACRRGDSEIRLIVGKGNHSDGGVSKLKPAIQDDLRKRRIPVEVDPRNPGVLVVQVGGR